MSKQCEQCGRILPRRWWAVPAGTQRATCATCRKPAHKRVHIRDIYPEQYQRRAFALLRQIDPDATPLTQQLRSQGYMSFADAIRLARHEDAQQQAKGEVSA